jgi:hypothetical protein
MAHCVQSELFSGSDCSKTKTAFENAQQSGRRNNPTIHFINFFTLEK